jgi:hypothetical protein
MADPIQRLETNIREVKRLLEIHKQLAGSAPGRKHKVEVLNKSAVVLLVACWEAFVEDLASAAFEAMLANATDYTAFPNDVLVHASKKLKGSVDHREVWRLAGGGWQTVLRDHKTELFKEYVAKLNTPKPKQIDGLFSALIGLSSLSSRWTWHRTDASRASKKLLELVELRGSIAHRVAASASVRKATVYGYLWFVYRLAVISSNRVRGFVFMRVKQQPWPRYQFRSTD